MKDPKFAEGELVLVLMGGGDCIRARVFERRWSNGRCTWYYRLRLAYADGYRHGVRSEQRLSPVPIVDLLAELVADG